MITVLFWLFFLLWILCSGILILVVLVQSGKGGGLSGLVGAGSPLGDHLGATGAEKTLNRWTTYFAVGFLVLNIVLVLLGPKAFEGSILDKIGTEEVQGETESGMGADTEVPAEDPSAAGDLLGETDATTATE
ncbi:MAG: preprotein translocase subunit SecG [Candidatus Sumerlaeia bacterium]